MKNTPSIATKLDEEIKKYKEDNIENWDNISYVSELSKEINLSDNSKDLLSPCPSQMNFVKVAPRVSAKKLNKLNTLRIQKIQDIIEDNEEIRGVKIIDLHLLNMKR